MSYVAIDGVLDHWADNRRLQILKNTGGGEGRFTYFSRGDFCCQISLDPPVNGAVAVHLWSVEVWEHEDFEYHWTVPTNELGAALDVAFEQGCSWMTSHSTKLGLSDYGPTSAFHPLWTLPPFARLRTLPLMNRRNVIILGIGLTLVVAGLGAKFVAHEWLTVDACYDSGGVYLQEIGKCSRSQAEVDRYRPKSGDR